MEPNLNEIILLPVDGAGTALALASPLFIVESTNTTEARIQSVATANGNEHTVQKFAIESLIGTKISEGELALVSSTSTDRRLVAPLLARILLL